MKQTYPGQSNSLNPYCIKAIFVSMVIIGSAIFLSVDGRPVTLDNYISLNTTTLQELLSSALRVYYNKTEGSENSDVISFKSELFLKGTINKRPGFSKPGLI